MITLSISDNHDSGACIFRDHELLFAVNEERLTRHKLQGGFPLLSIQACLQHTGILPSTVDHVLLASRMTPASMLRLLPSWHSGLRERESQFSFLLNLYIIYQVTLRHMRFPERIEAFLSGKIIAFRLGRLGIHAPVHCIDHHEAHAAGAYYSSGNNEKTLVFTLDAMGDGVSVTVNIGYGNELKRIYEQSGFSAIGTYYQRLTEFLGFMALRHEGKITSLASFGRFNEDIMAVAKSSLSFIKKTEGFNWKNHFIPESMKSGVYKQLKGYSREDVAFNFQKNFEDEIVKFVSYWVAKTDIFRVALAGGIAANVSLNHRIKDVKKIENVYVFPHMGDGGLAVGAGLAFLKPEPFCFRNVYLGPQYDNADIRSFLDNEKVTFTFLEEDSLCARVADLLAQGCTVGHFNGRMEFGPRSLGNRSILYRADDVSAMEWLNKKMDRSSFMPFAPISLDREAAGFYKGIDNMTYALKFMTFAVDGTDRLKDLCPAAAHIDGTARPQIVSMADNPRIYRILEKYEQKKGVATVLNTSFNRHEEPIVCSFQDALHSFNECALDVLVLNNFLIIR